MRLFRFLICLFLTLAAVTALKTSFKIGGSAAPPFGDFLNPFSGFWQNAENAAMPVLAQNPKLSGLSAPVSVRYDDRLVPHVFAQNFEDAARTQGFLHAQFRLFQMDLAARKGAGRLSEILGERTLEVDRDTRHRGMLRASQKMVEAWKNDPKEWAVIEAYTAGVNAFLATLTEKNLPIEYKLIGFRPEKWTPLKTAISVKNMAESLSSKEWDAELSAVEKTFGKAVLDELFPDFDPKTKPIIPDDASWKNIKVDLQKAPPSRAIPKESQSSIGFLDPKDSKNDEKSIDPSRFDRPEDWRDNFPGIGSNNWAVSGKRTASGAPILCNDPHLGLSLPSIWFEIQLHVASEKANGYGVSLPGAPGIVIGFNENIAWGQTNTGLDVLDWYRLEWADAAHSQYLLDGQPRAVETVLDTIWVKNQPKPIIEPVKWTVWGPIVSEKKGDLHEGMAMRWHAHDAPTENLLATFRGLMSAKNHDDYRAALKHFDTPSQNFVFASRDGDIALRVGGKWPIKRPGQGKTAQSGSLSENNWHGFIPFDEMPAAKNPSRGWVGSANQRTTSTAYPYWLWGADYEEFRDRRLDFLMSELPDDSITTAEMIRIQQDCFSQMAADALPALLALLDSTKLTVERPFFEKLKKWDFVCGAQSEEASLFYAWFDSTEAATWDEFESKKLEIQPEQWVLIEKMKKDPTSKWFDTASTAEKETAREIVTAAFQQIAKDALVKKATGSLAWSKVKNTRIRHLARIDAFSKNEVEIGGGKHILNAASNFWGPSWRMIVEMKKDGPTAKGVFPGGGSGNPGSRFYDNSVDTWAKGAYFDLNFWKTPTDGTAFQSQLFSAN